MSLRLLLAGLAGGILMFMWSGLAHMVLPLGTMGWSQMPNEGPVIAAMHDSMGEHGGLYMFPAMDAQAKDKTAAMKAYQAKAASGPSGLLLYHPAGQGEQMDAATLVKETLKEIAISLLAALLLAQTSLTGYPARVGFVSLVGLTAVLTTNPSYAIWYGFPLTYTLAYMFTELVGYVVAGLAIAAIMKPRA